MHVNITSFRNPDFSVETMPPQLNLLQNSHGQIQTPLHCELCHQDEEDETHLFL